MLALAEGDHIAEVTRARVFPLLDEHHQPLVLASLTADPEKAVDGCILRPPGIERHSLVKDVDL